MTATTTTTRPAELIGVALMTADEARQTVDRVRRGLDTMRRDLLNLYEREGWRALGYSSWRVCTAAEFGSSVATVYRQLEAAEIERDVAGGSQLENPIPTAQLQAVKDLPPAARAEAFKRADIRAAGRPRTTADVAAAAAELTPLPPLGEPLKHDWLRFRDDGTQKIVMQHQRTGYLLSGRDAAALEADARAAGLFLDELATFHWRVFFDPSAVGVAGLHAYTATHQEFDAISAPTIERLSLAAWRARLYEDDAPDMPDDVIEALYLAGWRWHGMAWAKGFERIDEDADINELRYTLGLDQAVAAAPAPVAEAHLPPDYAAAQKRARALGLYLDMNVRGEFSLTHEATGRAELAAGVTDWQVVLARLAGREAYLGSRPTLIEAGNVTDVARDLIAAHEAGDAAALAMAYAALGDRLCGPRPTRPKPPRSADVSAQVAYTTALEKYATALEARLGIRN